jgi:glutathione synthase/RimK-type ligase-like ATP-grasp enzyme
MLKKAALLSMDSLENFFTYDKLLIEPMKQFGWLAEEVSWRNKNINWGDYDAVIVRSTWDYQNDSEKFVEVLNKINSLTHLENDLELMKWNMNKKYLFDLEKKGVKIVTTLWENKFDRAKALSYFETLDSEEIIIKPNISASADNTFRLNKNKLVSSFDKLENIFADREFMVQPFIKNIISEGEYSLFFFNGKLSHSVRKIPKENDFRVQEEHGGDIQPITAPEKVVVVAESIIKQLSTTPLYLRVDLVRV